MAIPSRHVSSPGTYFVSSRTWENRAIFHTAPPCEVFIASLLGYRDAGGFQLHAFVIMPDHIHVLLTPSDETTLERSVQFIKGGSAKRIRDQLLFRFPVWQRGFSDHRVRDAADYSAHYAYLLENPVKAGLVIAAGDYKWSSASGNYRMDEVPQGLKPLARVATIRHG
ncbi:MAG TPA: transposase [Candidatus Limnocylindrales bacterium]|nr:transposase [Candidatus Limnocylindrales bacterium]